MVDVGVGIAMGTTGVGSIPGVALMYVGIDQILQGSMNMRYGRVGKRSSNCNAASARFGSLGSKT